MRLFRQLGTWGTAVVLTPILWLASCALARELAQHAYDRTIAPATRVFRVLEPPGFRGSDPLAGTPVKDPKTLTELQKYLQVWSLEPGSCRAFPDAARFPWCWNPFRPSAFLVRLRQKQAFLTTQRHEVRRAETASGSWRYFLAPDSQAALGGRHFLVEAEGTALLKAVEW